MTNTTSAEPGKFCDMMDDDVELDPTLHTLLNTKSLQWIFVGGKGGVGKTTTACSIAVQLAKRRESVLILSTDPAHNLSDAFTQKFCGKPTQVNGFSNLFAMEIEATVQENMAFKLDSDSTGFGKILPELMSALPGIDEAMSFAELMNSVQTLTYSVIVFDTAPTGHTLRLLSFPDLLEKALKKFNHHKEQFSGAFDMMSAMTGQAGDVNSVTAGFDHIRAITTSVREQFRDPTRTTFVCVLIPEFLSVYETERLIQQLAKQGIDASNVVVNQVLFPLEDESVKENVVMPKISGNGNTECEELKRNLDIALRQISAYKQNFYARRRMQSKYLNQIRDLYSYDYHVVPMPLLQNEVRGKSQLESFGDLLLTKKVLPILSESDQL